MIISFHTRELTGLGHNTLQFFIKTPNKQLLKFKIAMEQWKVDKIKRSQAFIDSYNRKSVLWAVM